VQISELKNLLMNHGAAQPSLHAVLARTTARPNSAESKTASTSPSITSNDFLKLLVAEMKNQDPTATTDPNAYIDQLVQVNSLQQLIQINADLGGTQATAASSAKMSNALNSFSSALPHLADNTTASKGKLAVEQQ
jgi:flagellar basal-body rod modification protein FlgD